MDPEISTGESGGEGLEIRVLKVRYRSSGEFKKGVGFAKSDVKIIKLINYHFYTFG